MSLIRKPAPHFKATAWYENDFVDIDLKSYEGKYVLLFFYPLDFTFVCPTEIIAFNDRFWTIVYGADQLLLIEISDTEGLKYYLDAVLQ